MVTLQSMKKVLLVSLLSLLGVCALAQTKAEDIFSFSSKVHDFGTISVKDGPVSCTFTLTNKSGEDGVIYAVVSSCGCTGVNWTRTVIAPGESGKIEATYSNEDGPYPFDKTLTVYVKDADKPAILHIRGTVTNKKSK